MNGNTSIGPAEPTPPAGSDPAQQVTQEGVDAQDANALDMRRGLAGAEAKPFTEKPAHRPTGSDDDHEAASSQPDNDPNRSDPNQRSDMISERRNPGSHGGAGSPGRKT